MSKVPQLDACGCDNCQETKDCFCSCDEEDACKGCKQYFDEKDERDFDGRTAFGDL